MHQSSAADQAARTVRGGEVETLAKFIADQAPLWVLTGAGVSTDSGIPDYRDRQGRWKGAEPIHYQAFVRDPAARRRYWSRSLLGWPRVAAASPNDTHRVLAELERMGLVHQIVTQNVDGLHQRAGSRRVIDLHGRLDRALCLHCSRVMPRARMQQMLASANPRRTDEPMAQTAPDGDAHLALSDTCDFAVPPCPVCGGTLKPAVVFFGENVPRARVERAFGRLRESRGLLVLGSSLSVYSGYRFCVRASEQGIPIAILNRGSTRADALATLRIDQDCAPLLSAVRDRLRGL